MIIRYRPRYNLYLYCGLITHHSHVRVVDLFLVLPMCAVADVEGQEGYGRDNSQNLNATKEAEKTL